jgi:hypothetical protein
MSAAAQADGEIYLHCIGGRATAAKVDDDKSDKASAVEGAVPR